MWLSNFYPLSILAAVTWLSGCTSVSTTALNRTDNDSFYGSSNGQPGPNGHTKPFKGIPVTVRVPTHVDVIIKEKLRLHVDGQDVTLLRSPQPHLFVETAIVDTEKVFTVDPKRPGAGKLDYNIGFGSASENFDNRQYFNKITSTVEDNTIKDITQAIDSVTQAIRTSGTNRDGDIDFAGIEVAHRTVAWRRFDLDAPDCELQIQCFVEQHLNHKSTSPLPTPQINDSLADEMHQSRVFGARGFTDPKTGSSSESERTNQRL